MPTRNCSRRRPPAQNGGILATLSSNSDCIRTPPPKTLIVSKKCDATPSDDEEDVSILESPCLNHSSDETSLEEGGSDEESDDELSTDLSEDDDSASEKSSNDSSVELCSEDEEELDIDHDSSHEGDQISENNPDEIASDPDGESDFDPDDTLSDDEDLEADEDSVESKQEKKKESSRGKYTKVNENASDIAAIDVKILDQNDPSDCEDDAISVIAEIIEDSDTELSYNYNKSDESFVSPVETEDHNFSALDVNSADQNPTATSKVSHEENEYEPKENGYGHCQNGKTREGSLHADTDVDSQGTTKCDLPLRDDGELNQSVESPSDALNCRYLQSMVNSSERKHEEREITFLSGHGSAMNNSNHNELTGLLCSDLSISPIKSGFTPERISKVDSSPGKCLRMSQISLNAEDELYPKVSVGNITSTNPNLFSPILARSTRHDNKSTSSSEGNQKYVHTPTEKCSWSAESPMIERSINRALRSLVKHDKASNRKNIRKGEWVLGAKLGSGAFGVVHVGMNTSTGSLMAVKSIRMENVAMKDVRREIELLKSLEHPNIVIYHGAEMDKKYLHIFQEWVPGGSLCTMLSKFGSFRRPVLRNYLSQILKGLAYLHDQRVMHRDLKGSNVLVNDAGIVKLADFGSSKRFEGYEGNMMLSLTMRGTPYFMAPEVFEEKYSFKADIWSVGCVAFQMATASPPWKDMGFTNPVSLFNHVKATDGIPRGKVDIDDSLKPGKEGGSLSSLLHKCFHRNPAMRPNAAELLCEPFFEDQSNFSDDNVVQGKFLFGRSPSNEGSVLSPCTSKMSPITVGIVRRNSLSSLHSPLLSPPVPVVAKFVKSPLPRSPQPDPKNWPSWARGKHQEESSERFSENTYSADSLIYSSGKASDNSITNSPLMGLKFLSIS